jgi:hypothetical protein
VSFSHQLYNKTNSHLKLNEDFMLEKFQL